MIPSVRTIIAGLRWGFFFRFAGLSVEEMVACPDSDRRAALFTLCARLQHGQTDCIFPPNELVRDLVLAHADNPGQFDWKKVDVRAIEFERGIQRRKIVLDAGLSAEQRTDQINRQTEYRSMFSDIRPKIEAVFADNGEAPPTSFRGILGRMESGDIKLMLQVGKIPL